MDARSPEHADRTARGRHGRIVRDIVDGLAALDASGPFGRIAFYGRAGKLRLPDIKGADAANEALHEALLGGGPQSKKRTANKPKGQLAAPQQGAK